MKYVMIIFLGLCIACSDPSVQEELKQTQDELKTARAAIKNLEQEANTKGQLVHIVLFKLKPDADKTAMLVEIEKLEAIEEILELEVGIFEDLGDSRALSEYSVVMEMNFADSVAYQNYQKHPIHLALKENAIPYMAGPPATYDFIMH